MKYIIIPMAVIIGIFIFGLFLESGSATYQRTFNPNSSYTDEVVNGTFTEDGTEKSLTTGGSEYGFQINNLQGMLSIVIAVSVVSSLIGIRVLGSGLSEMTVKILYNTIFFYGVWALFSVFSLSYILLIPIGGWILYFILTGMLSFGIVKQINGGSNA